MNGLRVDSFKPLAAQLNLPTAGATKSSDGSSFGKVLNESLKEVNNLQMKADQSVEALASGQSKNIHETMLDLSKADLAFRMTVAVRNKVIEAYQEVMRMSI